MKIREITFEMGNDFCAVLVCEHCGATQDLKTGYNDDFYHNEVMPAITCKSCGLDRAGNRGDNYDGMKPV